MYLVAKYIRNSCSSLAGEADGEFYSELPLRTSELLQL